MATYRAVLSVHTRSLGPAGKVQSDRAERTRHSSWPVHANGEERVELCRRHHRKEGRVGLLTIHAAARVSAQRGLDSHGQGAWSTS